MNGSDIFALTAIGAGVAQMASTAPAPNWVAILTIVSLVLVVLERLGKVAMMVMAWRESRRKPPGA